MTRPHTRSQAVGPRTQSLALTSPGGPSLQFNIDIMFILFNCLSLAPHRRCVNPVGCSDDACVAVSNAGTLLAQPPESQTD